MNASEIESQYSNLKVVTEPEDANLLFDSTIEECLRINGWVERSNTFQVAVQSGDDIETVTVPQYLRPSNQYYFVQSQSLREKQ